MCADTSEVFEILIAAGAATNTASEALRVQLRDKDLFSAAKKGQLGKLKELIASGADPNGHKDPVRVIAEAGRAPPHPSVRPRPTACRPFGCRIASVEFASARVVWFSASSSRRRPDRPLPPSSSESSVAVIRVVLAGYTRSTGRATTPNPTPGSRWSWAGRALEMARTAAGYFGRCGVRTSEPSSTETRP